MSSPDRSPVLIIWTIVVVATLALFGLLSWRAFAERAGPWMPAGVVTPTATPTVTPTVTPTPANGSDVGSAGVEPSGAATAALDALVAAVLTRIPTATPAPTPDTAATATAQAAFVTTAVASAMPAAGDRDDMLALWVSAVSAITALLGLATSAIFGWRREVREARQAQVELEKTRLEVERLKRELENPFPSTHSADAR
jgi:hypothetical protein